MNSHRLHQGGSVVIDAFKGQQFQMGKYSHEVMDSFMWKGALEVSVPSSLLM